MMRLTGSRRPLSAPRQSLCATPVLQRPHVGDRRLQNGPRPLWRKRPLWLPPRRLPWLLRQHPRLHLLYLLVMLLLSRSSPLLPPGSLASLRLGIASPCALTLVTPVMRMTHLTLAVAVTPHRLLSAGSKQLAVCPTVW